MHLEIYIESIQENYLVLQKLNLYIKFLQKYILPLQLICLFEDKPNFKVFKLVNFYIPSKRILA